MINERSVKTYCSEDISKIENYSLAIADKTQTWHCHHRGEILSCGVYSVNDLVRYNLYNNRPADELIFLTEEEHKRLHARNMNPISCKKISKTLTGIRRSSETREKMSLARRGRPPISEETRARLSESHKGKQFSEHQKMLLSEHSKGRRFYTNGVINKFCRECPEGFWRGKTLKKKEVE